MRKIFYLTLFIASIFFLGACTDQGEQEYNQGVKSLNEGKLEQARSSFLKALEESPHLAEAYLNLGRIDIKRTDYASARENTLKALNMLREHKKTIKSGITWSMQAALACNNMASITFQEALLLTEGSTNESGTVATSSGQTAPKRSGSSDQPFEAADALINEAAEWLEQALELDPANETVIKNQRFIQKWREGTNR